jgi:hypothetical protein
MGTDTTKMTIEDARKNLPLWLDLAAHQSIYSQWDKKCDEAYKILGHDEYDKIHKQWESGYVLCSDHLYRKR